jgi:dethiobiotin synthetase
MPQFVITGTDTDIGKTVCSAMLMQALGATYWKPIQSGMDGMVDARRVQQLSGLPNENFLPERYIFSEPLSPHRAAEIDEQEIDLDELNIPDVEGTLLIEGAGGLMVPLTRENLLINVFKRWQVPVILCARTGLGTINHTLLSLEALWARDIPIHGLVFIGEDNIDNIRTIAEFSKEKILGHIPHLEELNAAALADVFDTNFSYEDFV